MNGVNMRLARASAKNQICHFVQKSGGEISGDAAPAKAVHAGAKTTAIRKYLPKARKLSNHKRCGERRRNSQAHRTFLAQLGTNNQTRSDHGVVPENSSGKGKLNKR